MQKSKQNSVNSLNSLVPPGADSGTVVHLFPGQGDFSVSPLARAASAQPLVRSAVAEVFEEVDKAGAEYGLDALGPALLSSTPPTGRQLATAPVGTPQLALFGASVAVHRALWAAGLAPDRLVGVSFGEIAALTAAGVFGVADGARAACELARLLSSCEGGMTLLAAGEDAALSLIRRAQTPQVALACVNAPDETVLSGPLSDLSRAEALAEREGLATTRLRLPFLSHHPSLTDTAGAFAAAVRRLPAGEPRLAVHSAVQGRAYTAEDDLARGLADCLVRPARVPGVLRAAARPPFALLLEAGTGPALTRAAQRFLPPERVAAHAPLAEPDFPWQQPDRPAHPRTGGALLPSAGGDS